MVRNSHSNINKCHSSDSHKVVLRDEEDSAKDKHMGKGGDECGKGGEERPYQGLKG